MGAEVGRKKLTGKGLHLSLRFGCVLGAALIRVLRNHKAHVSEAETWHRSCAHKKGVGGRVCLEKTDRRVHRGVVPDGCGLGAALIRDLSNHKAHVSEAATWHRHCAHKEGVGGQSLVGKN